MEFFRKLYTLLRHLGEDAPWRGMIGYLGPNNLYIVLFAIIFAETGLVVTPFLPGDSLLFATGALAAEDTTSGTLNAPALSVLLGLAAVLGNSANYAIGRSIGPAAFSGRYRLLKVEYLRR